MTPDVRIYEFTDPGCPWAWSAEPFRRRLDWLYGERIEWRAADGRPLRIARRSTVERGLHARAPVAARSGASPASTGCRSTPASARGWWPRSRPAGRSSRTRVHAPERDPAPAAPAAGPALQRLAARRAGDDRARRDRGRARPGRARALERRTGGRAELRADMAAAREPMPAARVLDERARQLVGRAPLHVPELRDRAARRRRADLDPRLPALRRLRRAARQPRARDRPPRAARRDVAEVLGAGPAVAAGHARRSRPCCDVPIEEARERLSRVADEEHVGADGFWTLLPVDARSIENRIDPGSSRSVSTPSRCRRGCGP